VGVLNFSPPTENGCIQDLGGIISLAFMAEQVMNTRATRKAKAILNRLLESRIVSPEAVRWLTLATDPFHDVEMEPAGFPDLTSTSTIVQRIKLQTTPTSTLEGNYDMHIFFLPVSAPFTLASMDLETPKPKKSPSKKDFLVPKDFARKAKVSKNRTIGDSSFYENVMQPSGTISNNASGIILNAGLNIIVTPADTDWTVDPDAYSIPDLAIPPQYCAGSFRLVGVGFEVHNVTAELYKGGTCTNYRSPCPFNRVSANVIAPTGLNYYAYGFSMDMGLLPPSNLPDATTYPNSNTWGAEYGNYSVVCLNSTDNPFKTAAPNVVGFAQPQSASNLEVGNQYLIFTPLMLDDGGNPCAASSLTQSLPFDISGSIYSGLLPQATLTVSVNYYFERDPTIADPDLLVLSRPATGYDPVILQIYNSCMGKMPISVQVGENPLGEWFADILDAVSTYAPIVGAAVGNFLPGAQALGSLLGGGAKAALPLVRQIDAAPKPSNAQVAAAVQNMGNRVNQRRRPNQKFIGPMPLFKPGKRGPRKRNRKNKKKKAGKGGLQFTDAMLARALAGLSKNQ